MPSAEELADLLVVSRAIWRKQDFLSLDKELQDDAVRRLHAYGVLSVSALGSLVGVSPYRVEKAIQGTIHPAARGHLNPSHLTMLIYGLSVGDVPPRWVETMTTGGTSLSTIVQLTGISESTLRRRRN